MGYSDKKPLERGGARLKCLKSNKALGLSKTFRTLLKLVLGAIYNSYILVLISLEHLALELIRLLQLGAVT